MNNYNDIRFQRYLLFVGNITVRDEKVYFTDTIKVSSYIDPQAIISELESQGLKYIGTQKNTFTNSPDCEPF